jgi:hypothetical protein
MEPMARAGRNTTIGRSTRTGKKRDFAGSGAEGEKADGKAEDDMSEKMQKITDAIKTLNPEDFTVGGKPKVEAIEATLGFDISAQERDDAWQACQEATSPKDSAEHEDATEDPPAATQEDGANKEEPAAKKSGPVTIADVVKQKRAQGMKI